jgi:hypothetical protein
VLTLASTSDAAGIALGAPKARRRQRFKMLRVQTRGTGRANEACARRWSGCPVRPCFWPSTLLFRTLTCATAAGHGSLDGTFVFSSPWRPEPNAKDGSKTSLKVAWHHTPTHSQVLHLDSVSSLIASPPFFTEHSQGPLLFPVSILPFCVHFFVVVLQLS